MGQRKRCSLFGAIVVVGTQRTHRTMWNKIANYDHQESDRGARSVWCSDVILSSIGFHRAAAEIYFIHSYIFIRIERRGTRARAVWGRIFVILIYIVGGRQSITVEIRMESFMIQESGKKTDDQKLFRYVSGELLTEISDV